MADIETRLVDLTGNNRDTFEAFRTLAKEPRR
jgi:hypothetical protein